MRDDDDDGECSFFSLNMMEESYNFLSFVVILTHIPQGTMAIIQKS